MKLHKIVYKLFVIFFSFMFIMGNLTVHVFALEWSQAVSNRSNITGKWLAYENHFLMEQGIYLKNRVFDLKSDGSFYIDISFINDVRKSIRWSGKFTDIWADYTAALQLQGDDGTTLQLAYRMDMDAAGLCMVFQAREESSPFNNLYLRLPKAEYYDKIAGLLSKNQSPLQINVQATLGQRDTYAWKISGGESPYYTDAANTSYVQYSDNSGAESGGHVQFLSDTVGDNTYHVQEIETSALDSQVNVFELSIYVLDSLGRVKTENYIRRYGE